MKQVSFNVPEAPLKMVLLATYFKSLLRVLTKINATFLIPSFVININIPTHSNILTTNTLFLLINLLLLIWQNYQKDTNEKIIDPSIGNEPIKRNGAKRRSTKRITMDESLSCHRYQD